MTTPVTVMVAAATVDVTVANTVEARLTVAVSTNVLADVTDITTSEAPFFTVTLFVLVAVVVVLTVISFVLVTIP